MDVAATAELNAPELPERRVSVNQIVGMNIAFYRKAAGLTQEELGRRLGGWTKVAVSAAERSWDGLRIRKFDADELVTIARALGVPALALLLPPEDAGSRVRYVLDAPGSPHLSALLPLVMPGIGPDSSAAFAAYRQRLLALGVREPEQVIEKVRSHVEVLDQNNEEQHHLGIADVLDDIKKAGELRDELEDRVKELRSFEREYRRQLVTGLQEQLLYLLGAAPTADSGVDVAVSGRAIEVKSWPPGSTRLRAPERRRGVAFTPTGRKTFQLAPEASRVPASGPDAAAARDLYAALIPVIARVLGHEHPDTLAARGNLASWTGHAGNEAGARDLYAELLPVMERVLGVDHRDTVAARGEFAWWAVAAGDAVGSNDQSPEALAYRAGHALWTGEIGNPQGAREEFAALLPVMDRVFGAEHPETLSARHELARWTGVAGDPVEAREEFAALLPVMDRVLGAEHPETLSARHELARWTGEAGDPVEARDQFAALLPVMDRVPGAEHPAAAAVWTVDSAELLLRGLGPAARRLLRHTATAGGRIDAAALRGPGGDKTLKGLTGPITKAIARQEVAGVIPAGLPAPVKTEYDTATGPWQRTSAFSMPADIVPVFKAAFDRIDH